MFLFESWLFRILETNHFSRLHSVFSAVVMNSSCNRKSCSICQPLFSISSCWTHACWPGQQCLRNAGWHSCHRVLFSFWTALQEWLSSHIVLAGGQETSSGKCKMGVWNTLLPILTGETKHSFLYCFLCRWVTSGHYLLGYSCILCHWSKFFFFCKSKSSYI